MLTLLVCFTALPARADGAKEKVILDQDALGPATSNLESLLMLIQSPNVDVLGITVISGDGWRDENVAHTLRMLEIIGRTDIPVVPGAVDPLVNSREKTKHWEALYGKLVYKGCWTDVWPKDAANGERRSVHAPDVVPPLKEGDPTTKPSTEAAANFLVRKVREFPGQVTIYAAGPMTDIALACEIDPQFPTLVKEIVMMGGSIEPIPTSSPFSLEFRYTPRLEFNFRFDPEAAHIVMHAPWKKLIQIPVDPTTKTQLTQEMLDQIATSKTPAAQYIAKYGEVGYPLWDEVAAAVLLDPSIVTKSQVMFEDIDTSFTAGYGNTLTWDAAHAPGLGEQKADVVLEVDVDKLNKLFVSLIQASTPPAPAAAP
ncbi:MAG TPA: nucleoside hydrolase [Steroidobacteraceae bacterium]